MSVTLEYVLTGAQICGAIGGVGGFLAFGGITGIATEDARPAVVAGLLGGLGLGLKGAFLGAAFGLVIGVVTDLSNAADKISAPQTATQMTLPAQSLEPMTLPQGMKQREKTVSTPSRARQ